MSNDLNSLSGAGKDIYNKIVGLFGADNVVVTSTKRNWGTSSLHETGDAIDFKVNGMTNEQVQAAIANSGIQYGKLINEISGPKSTGEHVHIQTGTARENEVYRDGNYLPVSDKDLGAVTVPVPVGATSNNSGNIVGSAISNGASALSELLGGYVLNPMLKIGIIIIGALVIALGLYQAVKEPIGTVMGPVMSTVKAVK